jgi:hypothetical protein
MIRKKFCPVEASLPSRLPQESAISLDNEGSIWSIWTSFGIGGAAIATGQSKSPTDTMLTANTTNVHHSSPSCYLVFR